VLHRRQGTVRQDAFALARAGEAAVAVVCDGVGQLDRSDEAATLTSRGLAELVTAGVSWPEAFARANERLGPQDTMLMATTAVAVTASWQDGAWTGETAWVGDSELWHLSGDGQWAPITGPRLGADDGEWYDGRVKALPSRDGACDWCGFRIRGGALFLMSDGVANPLRWSQEVQDTLADWWASPPDPFVFAAQVAFARQTHMDDRTVVGIWGGVGDEGQAAGLGTTDTAG
jgi:serine/threonine protein phosphatase PrpC